MKPILFSKIFISIFTFILCTYSFSLTSLSLEEIDISQPPSKRDWKFFHRMPQDKLKSLWNYQVSLGKDLKDWSWEWRIGWIRVCIARNDTYCRALLHKALFDKAMVVRSEIVKRLGEVYENSQNPQVIHLLAQAFRDKRNLRNQKPMFILYHILFSIHQVGGGKSKEIGSNLAKQYIATLRYWNKIEKK